MEIKAILAQVLSSVKKAKELNPPKNMIETSALRWELYASLQNILDAIVMIVYAELGDVLHEHGIVGEGIRDHIRMMAVTRNMLAHAYRRLRIEDLDRIVKEILPIVEETVDVLDEIIGEKGIDPPSIPILSSFKGLAKILRRNGVSLAYLFGSRAKGVERPDSDYDIAALFKGGATIMNEIRLAIDIADALHLSADKIDITGLNNADQLLKARVLEEGVPLYAENEEVRRRWERNVYLELLRSYDLYAIYVARSLRKLERRKRPSP